VIGAVFVAAAALAGAGLEFQPQTSAVVWAVGDGADGSTVARDLARRLERDDPDAVLYLGDVYPSGSAEDYERNYEPVYGALAPITWPTAGNHDWENRATGYLPYWRRYDRAEPWYRFDLAGWELVSLNSEEPHDPSSPQLRWLERVLSERTTTCRLAFWHRPRFSAGTVHGDAPDVAPFWRALRGRARLVLNGHEHVLARYDRRVGLTEYVSGAGGELQYALRTDGRMAFGRSDRTGALRIVLTPSEARLEFRDVSGKLLDRSQASCRPAPARLGRGSAQSAGPRHPEEAEHEQARRRRHEP
jgi:Calcineurin-like phosphoesterase